MNQKDADLYRKMIADCMREFGSQRALARLLGVGHSTLTNRINKPETIKHEHLYAIEHLHERITR